MIHFIKKKATAQLKKKIVVTKFLYLRVDFLFLKKDFIYLFLERGEGRERNINVWSPLMRHPPHPPGTWPGTQAGAPTRNQTGNPLAPRPMLNPLSCTSQGKS